MNGANAVFASFAVPAVTIARDPTIGALREKTNARDEQKPGDQLPTGEREPNPRPGVSTRINAAARIHALHETHGLFAMNLREAACNGRVVQIQSFDAMVRVQAAQARDAGAAKVAASIVEDRQFGHEAPACRAFCAHTASRVARRFILARRDAGDLRNCVWTVWVLLKGDKARETRLEFRAGAWETFGMTAASSSAGVTQAAGMSQLVDVQDGAGAWTGPASHAVGRGRWACEQLEAANILFFPRTPFGFPQEDREFLLGQKQTRSGFHKNVAYRPAEDRITGLDKIDTPEAERLRAILRNYSRAVVEFLTGLLSPYAGKWKLDYASFRPLEEKGRPARLHARNDLPHFDSFPTRPTQGDRILRFFTNINPTQSRVWLTSQTFEALGPEFAKKLGLPRSGGALRGLARALRLPGANRSAYDEFMHRCHNAMKEDAAFQAHCPKQRWEFPPDANWMVFTDSVSHAVLEGRYALEQTFLVSRSAMVQPERAPIAVLERIAGRPLSN